jgi:homoisocitrate dehydrogenase
VTTRICVIPGDGIGREVIPAAVAVLRATGLPLEFSEVEAGWACFERRGTALPEETLAAARAADAVLFGAVASPSQPVPGYRSPIVALRRALDLYANIRPVASHSGRKEFFEGLHPSNSPVDLVVVRENTEGLYAGRERVEDGGNTAIAERVITRQASERIVRAAFELARRRAREEVRSSRNTPMVTIVHKANVLRETCGLFRSSALDVAREYPDVTCDELLVDTCALQLVTNPERFDVLVTTNLFGDILSDVACAWGGGLGLAVSANLGPTHALFEPVHGAAPDIAGQGVANPLAAIGCAALLLEHLAGRTSAAEHEPNDLFALWAGRIRTAVRRALVDGPHTPDLGGSAHTHHVTDAVLAELQP